MNKRRWTWAIPAALLVLFGTIAACANTAQAPSPAPQADKPVISFTANVSSIVAGQPVTLNWNVSGAKTVTLDPGIGNVNLIGSRQVSPKDTTTYTLSAVNDGGGEVRAVKVTVTPAVTTPADLVITEMTIPGSIIFYKIKNTGGAAAKQSRSYLYIDGLKAADNFVDNLAPGEEQTQSFSNYQATVSNRPASGDFQTQITSRSQEVRVCADAENAVAEGNENNNCVYTLWGHTSMYDFVQNAPLAEWRTNAGKLTWPIAPQEETSGTAFVFHQRLEDGSIYYQDQALVMHPRNVSGGVIQAIYGEPYSEFIGNKMELREVEVPIHAKFTTRLGFAQEATKTDGVKVSFGIVDPSGTTVFLKSADVFYDGKLKDMNVDLSSYAGQKVKFVLRVDAKASAADDWLVWVEPKIIQE